MPCYNFKRLYKSSLAKILGQYCENVDIAILTRYSLEYRANIGRTTFRQYCIVNNGQFWLKNIAQILNYQYWCNIGFTEKINKIHETNELRQMFIVSMKKHCITDFSSLGSSGFILTNIGTNI